MQVVPAKLELYVLLASPRLELPTHLVGTRKGKQLQALVFHERGSVLNTTGKDREGTWRQIQFSQYLSYQ